jgi:hypothetical protein
MPRLKPSHSARAAAPASGTISVTFPSGDAAKAVVIDRREHRVSRVLCRGRSQRAEPSDTSAAPMSDMFRVGFPRMLTCVSWTSFRQKY